MNFIENESPTKLRGGYYTHPEIALFLTRWVCEISPKRILEPSCGDGVFIASINSVRPECLQTLTAFEIDPLEAKKSEEKALALKDIKTDVLAKDFIEWGFLRLNQPAGFDAVLGNPPFIRYQYLDEKHQALTQKIFELSNLNFTKHTNAWVPFIILSMLHLRAEGRLAMVVPSELLHVIHAQPLRDFLAAQCSKILLIDPEELWFSNTLQGVVLLLAEKKSSVNDKSQGVAITQVRRRDFLREEPQRLFDAAKFVNGDVLHGKWMRAFLTKKERDLLKDIAQRRHVFKFKEIADVDVGIVTGANKFFLVSDDIVAQYKLQQWAHPMFGRSGHARGVIYDEESHNENRKGGLPANFLWFGPTNFKSFPESVKQYIANGESEGLHSRYKCRIREPWYNVPSVSYTSVAMLKRCHNYPRLILNKIGAYTTDTAYRIRPTKVGPEELVYSFVNSLTALTAELEGRHYGGGVLELVPSEIERLLIPIASPKTDSLKKLDCAIRQGETLEGIFSVQDNFIFKGIGFDKREQECLFEAWGRLRMRRQRM
jgi:adenine-specific DNA-methyltransferase